VRKLFRLIDWLMELPPPLDRQFWKDFDDFQKERAVPFFTTPERIAMQDRTWTLRTCCAGSSRRRGWP
jgi:hypothetical protein